MNSNKRLFPSYPFTPDDLSCLLWARTNHPAAHDAILQAENRATDEPARRPRADPYIRDCLAAIRRKMDRDAELAGWAEQAEVTAFGFEMQDRLVAIYGPVVLDPPERRVEAERVPESKPVRKKGVVAAAGGGGGGLWG